MGFGVKGEVLSIPRSKPMLRSKPMPRSKTMPRSKSKPRYPLYSSLVFCHSQGPMSCHDPINLLSLAKALPTTCTLHDASAGGNKTAAFCFSAPCTLVTSSHPFKEVNHSSSFSLHFLPLFYHPFLFQHP